MSVCFDTPREVTFRGRRRMSSHLLTLTNDLDELHQTAKRIGLKQEWFQPGSHPHYDLFDSLIGKARAAGIPEMATREALRIIRENRPVQ